MDGVNQVLRCLRAPLRRPCTHGHRLTSVAQAAMMMRVSDGGELFVIAGEASVLHDPSEGPLHDPASWQHLKAHGRGVARNDLQDDVGLVLCPCDEATRVAAVGVGAPHEGVSGYLARERFRTPLPPSRSWMSAPWTCTERRRPSVSVRMWRLRPLIFLPASSPFEPLFDRRCAPIVFLTANEG